MGSSVESFVPVTRVKPSTEIRLENSIAEMIDREYERLTDHANWRKKQQQRCERDRLPKYLRGSTLTRRPISRRPPSPPTLRFKDVRTKGSRETTQLSTVLTAASLRATARCGRNFLTWTQRRSSVSVRNVCLARTKSLVMYPTGSLKMLGTLGE